MKALVTGGGGFLGRYIVELLLERGDEVSIFCRGSYPDIAKMGVNVIRGDLRDPDAVNSACKDQEIVFHVASKIDMWGKRKDFEEINIKGTQNVVDACLNNNVSKLVYTSTASVVFKEGDLEGVDESEPYAEKFLAHYPKTKVIAEKIVLEANGNNGLITTALRPHLIWGPRDPSLCPRLIKQAKKGRLPVVGKGQNVLDVTYVANVADAHILAADSPNSAGQAYFISQGKPVNIWEFINELTVRIGIKPIKRKLSFKTAYIGGVLLEFFFKLFHQYKRQPLVTKFLASELAHSHYFDISKAKKELGYEPKISLEEGLDIYIDWLRKDDPDIFK